MSFQLICKVLGITNLILVILTMSIIYFSNKQFTTFQWWVLSIFIILGSIFGCGVLYLRKNPNP